MSGKERITNAKIIVAELANVTGMRTPDREGMPILLGYIADALREHYPYYSMPMVRMAIKQVDPKEMGDKSYGRTLSLVELSKLLDGFLPQVQAADDEVRKIQDKEAAQTKLSMEQQENIMRGNIQERYAAGDFKCTFVDYEQLVRDRYIDGEHFYSNQLFIVEELKVRMRKQIQEEELLAAGKIKKEDKKEFLSRPASTTELRGMLIFAERYVEEFKAYRASVFMKKKKEQGVEYLYKFDPK